MLTSQEPKRDSTRVDTVVAPEPPMEVSVAERPADSLYIELKKQQRQLNEIIEKKKAKR